MILSSLKWTVTREPAQLDPSKWWVDSTKFQLILKVSQFDPARIIYGLSGSSQVGSASAWFFTFKKKKSLSHPLLFIIHRYSSPPLPFTFHISISPSPFHLTALHDCLSHHLLREPSSMATYLHEPPFVAPPPSFLPSTALTITTNGLLDY